MRECEVRVVLGLSKDSYNESTPYSPLSIAVSQYPLLEVYSHSGVRHLPSEDHFRTRFRDNGNIGIMEKKMETTIRAYIGAI